MTSQEKIQELEKLIAELLTISKSLFVYDKVINIQAIENRFKLLQEEPQHFKPEKEETVEEEKKSFENNLKTEDEKPRRRIQI